MAAQLERTVQREADGQRAPPDYNGGQVFSQVSARALGQHMAS